MTSKKSSSQQLSPTERREIVQKELWEIFASFLNRDKTVDTSTVPEKYSGLGMPPFLQKNLVAYLLNKHPELNNKTGALTRLVRIKAKELKESDPAAAKIFHFNTHRKSDSKGSDLTQEIVKEELSKILRTFLKYDNTLKTSNIPKEYSGLGKPPFQQNIIVGYILDKIPDLEEHSKAIRIHVQREANNLKDRNKAAQKVFHFSPHGNSALGSPFQSRFSNAVEIQKIAQKLKELEEFQRKFETLLNSGRPEPQSLEDEAKE